MPNSLDALCRRYEIDLSERTTHNALLDCRLLAQVHIELTGGRQRGLLLAEEDAQMPDLGYRRPEHRQPVLIMPSEQELRDHDAFILRVLKDPIWGKH
jgi:DNA polymerase-3 subunit epsilon